MLLLARVVDRWAGVRRSGSPHSDAHTKFPPRKTHHASAPACAGGAPQGMQRCRNACRRRPALADEASDMRAVFACCAAETCAPTREERDGPKSQNAQSGVEKVKKRKAAPRGPSYTQKSAVVPRKLQRKDTSRRQRDRDQSKRRDRCAACKCFRW